MPLFDVKCEECGLEEERLAKFNAVIRCSVCNGYAKRIHKAPHTFVQFKERVFEHFGPQSITVSSKKQLKELCKKYDVGSRYLMDG